MLKKIMVVSHERSGTHLTLNSIVKNFGCYEPIEHSILGNEKELFNKIINEHNSVLIKSHHHPSKFYIDDLNEILKKVYIIYVVRNPLDVMTSCHHYFNKVNKDTFPITKNVNQLCYTDPRNYNFHSVYGTGNSKTMLERWLEHVNAWQSFDVHTIHYEDIIYNFFETMDELAEGLGFCKTTRYNFPSLKDRGVINRKGVAGDHLQHMTKAEIKKAEKYLSKRGYKNETRNTQ